MARVLRSAPYFPVADVAATAAYYRDTLGFATTYSAGEPPEFAMCDRDGFAIMLRRVPAPGHIVPSEAQGGTCDAFLWVDDANALHAELADRGATVVYGPIVQSSYHMLEFAVRDRDGHVLGFGQSMT
jgi:catechol 2,3-dioxygenase-like lactoylglutathione lyase family enzyme